MYFIKLSKKSLDLSFNKIHKLKENFKCFEGKNLNISSLLLKKNPISE